VDASASSAWGTVVVVLYLTGKRFTDRAQTTSTVPTVILGDVGNVSSTLGEKVIIVGFVVRSDDGSQACGVRVDTDPPRCGSYAVPLIGPDPSIPNGSHAAVHGVSEADGLRLSFIETDLGRR